MEIKNGTGFSLWRRHDFELFDEKTSERIIIEVIEDLITGKCAAVFSTGIGISEKAKGGIGDSIEEAVSDLLATVEGQNWDQIKQTVGGPLSVDPEKSL